MKKFIALALEILICFLLQTIVFRHLSIGGITPNILIILTVGTAYMKGQVSGLYMGLLCGLLTDLMGNGPLGLYGMVYMFIGYISGISYKIYYSDDNVMPVFLIGLSNLASGFMIYVFEFLLRSRLNLFFYAKRIIIPEALYTALVAIVLYKLLNLVQKKIDRWVYKEVSND